MTYCCLHNFVDYNYAKFCKVLKDFLLILKLLKCITKSLGDSYTIPLLIKSTSRMGAILSCQK